MLSTTVKFVSLVPPVFLVLNTFYLHSHTGSFGIVQISYTDSLLSNIWWSLGREWNRLHSFRQGGCRSTAQCEWGNVFVWCIKKKKKKKKIRHVEHKFSANLRFFLVLSSVSVFVSTTHSCLQFFFSQCQYFTVKNILLLILRLNFALPNSIIIFSPFAPAQKKNLCIRWGRGNYDMTAQQDRTCSSLNLSAFFFLFFFCSCLRLSFLTVFIAISCFPFLCVQVSDVEYVSRENFKSRITEVQKSGTPITPWFELITRHQLDVWWKNINALDNFVDHNTIHRF